jgi:hypothetical protein
MPPRLSEAPPLEAIKGTLSTLCTRGLRSWWIVESGVLLMGLDCARAYLISDPQEERDYAVAVRDYLETALGEMGSPPHRTIIEAVLGLGREEWRTEEWRNKSAFERREEAGRKFRGEGDIVASGTIRQVYEPRAIAELAEVISRDEQAARSELAQGAAEA